MIFYREIKTEKNVPKLGALWGKSCGAAQVTDTKKPLKGEPQAANHTVIQFERSNLVRPDTCI